MIHQSFGYRTMWRWWQPVRLLFALSMVAAICASGADAYVVYWLQPLIDRGFVDQSKLFVSHLLLFLPLLFVVRGLFTFFSIYGMAKCNRTVMSRLRQSLFTTVLKRSVSFFESRQESEWLTRISYHLEQLSQSSIKMFADVFRNLFLILFLLGNMMRVSSSLTLMLLIVVPVIVLIYRFSARRLRNIYLQVQKQVTELLHICAEAWQGHKEIRIYQSELVFQQHFNAINQVFVADENRLGLVQAAMVPGIQIVAACALSWGIYLASRGVGHLVWTAGEFATFITSMIALLRPLRDVSQLGSYWQKALAAGQGIYDWLATDSQGELILQMVEPSLNTSPISDAPTIRCRQLQFHYHQHGGCGPIDYCFQSGKMTVIIGSSGSGKTTLIGLLLGFYQPESGSILVNDQLMTGQNQKMFQRQIAWVGQQPVLFRGSILKNITWCAESEYVDHSRLQQAISMAHAESFIESLPHGIDTVLQDQGAGLSGGQRQRLALARAFYKQSSCLLIDEATSQLDRVSEDLITDAIKHQCMGMTRIVVAHRPALIVAADEVVVMENGKIIADGSPAELSTTCDVYCRLLHQAVV